MLHARVVPGLVLTILSILCGCIDATPNPPNIVLVVLDTVRADRVSCRSDSPVPTPRIDALCERGIFFEQVSSTSSWTLPSHASIFTGLYPIRHGATQEYTLLDEGVPTLAELLSANGYRTFGVSANPVVGIKSGLARGFDSFEETWRKPPPGSGRSRGHPNLRAIDELLEIRDRSHPFFLFVNFIEAHAPNSPPARHLPAAVAAAADAGELARARAHDAESYYLDPESVAEEDLTLLSALYDSEIAQLDELVGRLVDRLEADGTLADSVLIVTSDHGENFGDHGHFRHVFSLYRSTVQVPLLVVLPGAAHAGERRGEPVALVDLFATILAAAGVASPANAVDARDLFGAGVDEARPVVAEYYYPAQALTLFGADAPEVHRERLGPYLRRLRSIESNGLRYIWSSDGRHELYDVAADPVEARNVAGDPRFVSRERELLERLDAFVAAASDPAQRPAEPAAGERQGVFEDLDPESAELLRELGYVRE